MHVTALHVTELHVTETHVTEPRVTEPCAGDRRPRHGDASDPIAKAAHARAPAEHDRIAVDPIEWSASARVESGRTNAIRAMAQLAASGGATSRRSLPRLRARRAMRTDRDVMVRLPRAPIETLTIGRAPNVAAPTIRAAVRAPGGRGATAIDALLRFRLHTGLRLRRATTERNRSERAPTPELES